MKDKFKDWMIVREGKSSNTASQYKSSIDFISRHYSQQTNKRIDLYNTTDLLFIKGLVKDYGIGGKYQNIGQNGHGTVRNAIATYARFLEYKNMGSNLDEHEKDDGFKLKNDSDEDIKYDNKEVKIKNKRFDNGSDNIIMAKYEILQKENIHDNYDFLEVKKLAKEICDFMNCKDVSQKIRDTHKVNAKSGEIQEILLEKMRVLGFSSEKKGLFNKYRTSALRPDYYKKLAQNRGIIMEVERGKTIANNMDMLDIWKCHICEEANYLFLVVPQIRQKENGTNDVIYEKVIDRLKSFFEKNNYINVDVIVIFGY